MSLTMCFRCNNESKRCRCKKRRTFARCTVEENASLKIRLTGYGLKAAILGDKMKVTGNRVMERFREHQLQESRAQEQTREAEGFRIINRRVKGSTEKAIEYQVKLGGKWRLLMGVNTLADKFGDTGIDKVVDYDEATCVYYEVNESSIIESEGKVIVSWKGYDERFDTEYPLKEWRGVETAN